MSLVQDDVLRFLESIAKPRKLASLRARISCSDAGEDVQQQNVSEELNDDGIQAAKLLPYGHYSSDLVVLSPPWGGPGYLDVDDNSYCIRTMLPCGDGFDLVALALSVAPNVALVLPRNTNDMQLKLLASICQVPYRVVNVYVSNKFKLKVVYYGPIARYLPKCSTYKDEGQFTDNTRACEHNAVNNTQSSKI